MRIAICDDEKEIRELLAGKVKNICPEAEIFLYRTGDELLAETKQPDILFLDIQMPGMDGMDTARELRKKDQDTILIFVTAIEEYVFQAFDVGAFHYIVKPFCDEKLETLLQKAVDQYCKTMENRKKQGGVPEKKHIMIQSGGTHTKIYLDKIVYAEVFNRKIIIHMTDGKIEYYGKLSDLKKMLGEDFFRPHRSYLIHFRYVVKYDASNIYLEQGSVLMAKQNYPDFVKQYLRYNQRKGSV